LLDWRFTAWILRDWFFRFNDAVLTQCSVPLILCSRQPRTRHCFFD
jgi:hypothetical protein